MELLVDKRSPPLEEQALVEQVAHYLKESRSPSLIRQKSTEIKQLRSALSAIDEAEITFGMMMQVREKLTLAYRTLIGKASF